MIALAPAIDVSAIIIALIGAGLLQWARDLIKARLAARRAGQIALSPEGRAAAHIASVDDSILVVARARDELEADNERLRAILEEVRIDRQRLVAEHVAERARLATEHAEEREQWRRERAELRAELDAWERRARELRAKLDQQHPDD